jgi:hypothetical protein
MEAHLCLTLDTAEDHRRLECPVFVTACLTTQTLNTEHYKHSYRKIIYLFWFRVYQRTEDVHSISVPTTSINSQI